MSIDHRIVDHSRLADLRASLADDFATQTARLRELTENNADTGDPGEAHNRAALLVATRRSIEQITALDWGGADPSPWLPLFAYGPFTIPEQATET